MIFLKKKRILKLPKLHTPTVSINGSILTVSNPESNGNFVERWEIYNATNSSLIAAVDISQTSFDLSAFSVSEVYVKLAGEGFIRSDASESVTIS